MRIAHLKAPTMLLATEASFILDTGLFVPRVNELLGAVRDKHSTNFHAPVVAPGAMFYLTAGSRVG